MARKVNNINYKGIAHTPSLVSDNDGVAAECINLAPDNGDLKPMPMPVKKSSTYVVENNATIVFIHKGAGYENFVELYSADGDENTKLFLKDADGNFLYGIGVDAPYWSNGSEIVSVQGIGDTLVVSTKAGTEYLLYRKDVPPTTSGTGWSTTSSYKPIGQRPPMPVIEFQMQEDSSVMREFFDMTSLDYYWSSENVGTTPVYFYDTKDQNGIVDVFKSLIASLEKRIRTDKKFYEPFFIRYAIKLKTGDYIMHSPPVLLLPSGMKCPIALILGGTNNLFTIAQAAVQPSKLCYKINNEADFNDWSDIVDGIDIFVSSPIYNYDYDVLSGGEVVDNTKVKLEKSTTEDPHDFGLRYVDGIIKQWNQYTTIYTDGFLFTVKEYDTIQMSKKITSESLFHKVSSLETSKVSSTSSDYIELPIEDLENLANLPTLPDDYNSHNQISPSLMQTYNNRLNMANVSLEVFDGFTNGFQPQSSSGYYQFTTTSSVVVKVYVEKVYYRVKKSGKTYTVQAPYPSSNPPQLDYTTYLYYPDADCFEAVVRYSIKNNDSYITNGYYMPIPMKRHEYLNGSYWYDNMNCLGKYVFENEPSPGIPTEPDTSTDSWYEIPNRFLMSSVGNPWHFPVSNMFDIGLGEIRALSNNAENMDAPQFGQNPIYVFSSDGVWTISINEDGTFRKLSYVSGDAITEPQGLGTSPTASAEQLTFFKTDRGIMMMSGSTIKEIDLVMRGRVFNPRIKLLPADSVYNGIPESGAMSSMSDIIDNACDSVPYATFAKTCSLTYDYINKRLLLFNRSYPYMYVYDIRFDFWSKMYPTTAQDGQILPIDDNPSTRTASSQPTFTSFSSIAMSGLLAVVQDTDGYLWYVGDQSDENSITERKLGFYVSKPIRFGTDEYKTLCNVVHNTQLSGTDIVKMALYGSRDGQQYWRMGTLKGTSYKFFVIVLYTCMLPSSRYAYTAFEWEARLSNKIR